MRQLLKMLVSAKSVPPNCTIQSINQQIRRGKCSQIQHSRQDNTALRRWCTNTLNKQHALIQKHILKKFELTYYFFWEEVDPSGVEEKEKEGENREHLV